MSVTEKRNELREFIAEAVVGSKYAHPIIESTQLISNRQFIALMDCVKKVLQEKNINQSTSINRGDSVLPQKGAAHDPE